MKYNLFFCLFIISCYGPKIDVYKQVTTKIDSKEAIVVAANYLDTTCCKEQYLRDSVEVWECPVNNLVWNVSFKKINWENILPSTIIVSVNKVTGNAAIVMQK